MNEPSPNKSRVSLTRAQLQEGLGAELFSLCQGITADGSLSKGEIVALGLWLRDNRDAPLPGIAFLTATLDRIIADGHVTRDEQRELMEAIEKVLPPEARKTAKVGCGPSRPSARRSNCRPERRAKAGAGTSAEAMARGRVRFYDRRGQL